MNAVCPIVGMEGGQARRDSSRNRGARAGTSFLLSLRFSPRKVPKWLFIAPHAGAGISIDRRPGDFSSPASPSFRLGPTDVMNAIAGSFTDRPNANPRQARLLGSHNLPDLRPPASELFEGSRSEPAASWRFLPMIQLRTPRDRRGPIGRAAVRGKNVSLEVKSATGFLRDSEA